MAKTSFQKDALLQWLCYLSNTPSHNLLLKTHFLQPELLFLCVCAAIRLSDRVFGSIKWHACSAYQMRWWALSQLQANNKMLKIVAWNASLQLLKSKLGWCITWMLLLRMNIHFNLLATMQYNCQQKIFSHTGLERNNFIVASVVKTTKTFFFFFPSRSLCLFFWKFAVT